MSILLAKKTERKTEMKFSCPRCGNRFTRFDELGRHNFVPTIGSDGEVESICLKCKMTEIHKAR